MNLTITDASFPNNLLVAGLGLARNYPIPDSAEKLIHNMRLREIETFQHKILPIFTKTFSVLMIEEYQR